MNLLNTDTQREGADSEKRYDDAGVNYVPKVSVIVPVYKVEKYLSECIDSILAQTFTDFELILVDDGSPDNSGKICDDYASRDPRIRVFHKENGGVVSARMLGLSHASGTFVIFLDGDDTWTKTALSGLISIAEESDADFIRGGFFYESEDRRIRRVVSPDLQGVFDIDDLLARPFKTIFDYTAMCVGGNLYRREVALKVADDIGNVRINHSEDGLFAVAAFLHSRKIAFSRDPFYYYLQRDGSALHRFNPQVVEAMEGFLIAMESILRKSGKFSPEKIAAIIQEHEKNALSYVFRILLGAPSLKEARKLRRKICTFIRLRNLRNKLNQTLKSRIRFLILSGDLLCCGAVILNHKYRRI